MADIHRWTWTWTLDGTPHAQNVLHLADDGAFQPIDQSKATEIGDAWNTATNSPSDWRERLGFLWAVQPSVQSIDQPNRPTFLTGNNRVGQGDPDGLPRATALCLRLQTTGTFNGRIFVPGYDEDQSVGAGPPSAGVITDTIAFFEDLISELLTQASMRLVVYSRTLDAFAPVTGVQRSDSSAARGWQYQRRRAIPLR